ncbi:TPA_asm: mini-chromosome maintainance protein [Altiarchaeum virus]|nr:TPA_asm: mini-chromosome maintainance protein [Altiarchaeum virus]
MEKETAGNEPAIPEEIPKEKTLKEIENESNLINISFLFWDTKQKGYFQNKLTSMVNISSVFGVPYTSAQNRIKSLEDAGFVKTERGRLGGVHLTEKGIMFTENYKKEKEATQEKSNTEKDVKKIIYTKTNELLELAQFYPNKKSLFFSYKDLYEKSTCLCDKLIENPDTIIEIFEKEINEQTIPVNFEGNCKFHARFTLPTGFNNEIRQVNSEAIGKFLIISGIITKASDVFPKLSIGVFQCPICGKTKEVEQGNKTNIVFPSVCNDCKKQTNFKLIEDESKYVDAQRIEIQENLEKLESGEEAKKITMWLFDDLTALNIKAGMEITATGILKLIHPKDKNSSVFRKFIEANNISFPEENNQTFSDDDFQKFRAFAEAEPLENIKKEIAPTVEGMDKIKEALALQLFSSPHRVNFDGTSFRLNSHILIIGDPAVAKTYLLLSTKELAPKGIYTSAESATGRGLTLSTLQVKNELGENYEVKAGAIVLANGGGLYLDEIDKIDEKTSGMEKLHEAMETGVVSLARAGIVGKYKADTYILAAANPKFGRFSSEKSISEQFNLSPSLLSRFDLIFPIQDIPEKHKDGRIADKIINSIIPQKENKEQKIFLKKYISYARSLNVKISDDANIKIKDFYILLRSKSTTDEMQITTRQLQGIIRLAISSAKARMSEVADLSDAERAISLFNYSMNLIAKDKETGLFDLDKITLGTKNERENYKSFARILDNLTKNGQEEIKTSTVVAECVCKGISEDEANKLLKNAKKEGTIAELKSGFIVLIK